MHPALALSNPFEFAAVHSAASGPAAAQQLPPVRAAAGYRPTDLQGEFEPSSPPDFVAARNSGEGDLQVTADWSGGEARFVLDELRFMAALQSEIDLMPEFLREPSPEFLRATERGAA